MPQYLNLPNGTSIEFPDGTDYETAMRKAREQFPEEFGLAEEGPVPKGGVNSEHILFRCGDKYKTSDDWSTAAKMRGEGCTQITGLEQSAPAPTTRSSPIAVQSTSKLQDTDLGSAAGTALLQTVGGYAFALLLFWVLARRLWKKPRRTPHELGLWVGSLIGCLSVTQSVGKLIGDLLYKNPKNINWSDSLIGIPVLFVVYFVAGYLLGWVFRKVKPLAGPVQTVAPNIPTSAPQAKPLTNSRPLHAGANFSSTKLEEKGWLEWFSLGVSNEEAGHIGKAIEAFREAVRINQDHFESYYNLGILYIKIGPFDKAINALEQAVRINPSHAGAWDSLGTAHGSAGQFSKAIVAFKNAVRVSPGDLQAWNNLALTYVAIGDQENAAKCFDKAQTKPIDATQPEENLNQVKLDLTDAAMDDEAHYAQALNELNTNKKPGLWAKALAQTANGGNPDGAYIALRVEQLKRGV
jgi:tetratricopeptide (TPR) repeat protein